MAEAVAHDVRGIAIARLELKRAIASGPTFRSNLPPEKRIGAADFLAGLGRAREGGARVVLLELVSDGGGVEESLAVYRALRECSRSGCAVVVYVAGYCASTATFIALAGDCVVMDPESCFVIHSMYAASAVELGRLNERVREIYAARTCTQGAELDAWLAMNDETRPECGRMTPAAAVTRCWADHVGGRERAEWIAQSVADGRQPWSPRRELLGWRDELQAKGELQ